MAFTHRERQGQIALKMTNDEAPVNAKTIQQLPYIKESCHETQFGLD